MNPKQALGTALREQRKKKRLSQEDLAFEAHLDRTYISLIELGRKSPTIETLLKIAAALEVKVSILIIRMEELAAPKKNDRSAP